MSKSIIKVQLLILLFLTFQGCMSVKSVYKTIAVKDKTILSEKSCFIIKTTKEGKTKGFFTSSLLPSVTLTGDVTTDLSGDILFTIDNTHFFTNSARTYTEGDISTFGKIVWHSENGVLKPSVKEKIELVDVTKGEIRKNELYFREDDGCEKVKNKFERIKETVLFLKLRPGFPDHFGRKNKANYFFNNSRKHEEAFYYRVKRELFPELYGIQMLRAKGLLDAEYDVELLDSTDDTVLGDDIGYRKSYSDTVIAEILREQRNNGTLLNDFTESFEFMEAMYNMDYFFDTYLTGALFTEKK